MTWDKDGGLAFGGKRFVQIPHFSRPDETVPVEVESAGMSMRDYFAAQALGGVLSDAAAWSNAADVGMRIRQVATPHEALAGFCYAMADAMLVVRDKETP